MNKSETNIAETKLDASAPGSLTETSVTIPLKAKYPEAYLKEGDCIAIKRCDIERINKEYTKLTKSKGILSEALPNILFGLSSALFGCFLGNIFQLYQSNQWEFWVSYFLCPFAGLLFAFAYISVLRKNKDKKERLAEMVKEKLLDPVGISEEKEND